MRVLSIVAIILSLAAIGVSAKSLAQKPDMSATNAAISDLTAKVHALAKQLDDQAADVDELNVEIGALEHGQKPSIPVDQIKETVRQEMQQQFAQFRNRGGQGGPGGPGGPAANLSPEQQKTMLKDQVGIEGEKADAVVKEMGELRESIRGIWRDNKGGSRDANVELMRAETEKSDQKLAAVLTPEELGKLKTVREQMMANFGRGRRGGNGGGNNNAPAPEGQAAPPAPAEQNF